MAIRWRVFSCVLCAHHMRGYCSRTDLTQQGFVSALPIKKANALCKHLYIYSSMWEKIEGDGPYGWHYI